MSELIVIKGKPTYKDPKRVLPGSLIRFQRSKKKAPYYFILKSTTNNYYTDYRGGGERYNKKYCKVCRKSTGLVFI